MNTRISVGDPLAAASNPFLRVHLGYFGLVLNRLDERCGQCHQLDCSHIRPGQASRTVPAGILFFVPVPEVKRRGRKRVFSTAFPLALIDRGKERMDFPSIFSIIHHETAEYKQVDRIFEYCNTSKIIQKKHGPGRAQRRRPPYRRGRHCRVSGPGAA